MIPRLDFVVVALRPFGPTDWVLDLKDVGTARLNGNPVLVDLAKAVSPEEKELLARAAAAAGATAFSSYEPSLLVLELIRLTNEPVQ